MAEVMRRGADDVWDEHLLLTESDTLTLTSVGFRVPLATLYRTV